MAKLSRRNTIIGLGALVGGSGALAASGAFTQVEAERTVDIQTAGDDGALLRFDIKTDDFEGISDGGDGDIIELDINDLNLQATTRFDGALGVENTGANDVGLYIDDGDSGSQVGDILDIEHDGSSIVGDNSGAIDLDSNNGEELLDLVIDLTDYDSTGGFDDDVDSEDFDLMVVAAEDAHGTN